MSLTHCQYLFSKFFKFPGSVVALSGIYFIKQYNNLIN
nr:MAG TPA: hypothetical protein [Caudoviricetes sp.]